MTDQPTASDPDAHALVQRDDGRAAVTITLVDKAGFDGWLAGCEAADRAAIAGQQFAGTAGSHAVLSDGGADGEAGWRIVAGVADTARLGLWCLARLSETLPAGDYRLASAGDPRPALIGWALGQYRFARYKTDPEVRGPRILLHDDSPAIAAALAEAAAVAWVRDLVNTPAQDMGPVALEAAVRDLAETCGATVRVTAGDDLARAFPMVHAVGRAAAPEHAARMIELEWGDPAHPRLALVGKGVCFDSGGLDIKPSSGMALMKKDMGGAAHVLALAGLVMRGDGGGGLPVRLHLLIPAVENAIAGNAFRPGDVLLARNGLSVEVTNTDAEGRLVLGDALTRAGEENPALILDFATLTGAARVALGPDLPALMAREDATAAALIAAGLAAEDPCWRLPLPEAYREYLASDIADLNNSPANGFAGASVAGLFLDRFVPEGVDWAHFDTFAWRPVAKPGRPRGGEALGLRAAWHMLRARFA